MRTEWPALRPVVQAPSSQSHLPACRSNERYRALELHLRRKGPVPDGTRLLEIVPIDTVEETARSLSYSYVSLDLHSPRATVRGDLTRIPFPDSSFDVVICFHVLEHIVDDRKAVRELARIVSADGDAIVVVPRAESRPETFEVGGADPADYERLYGQSDHVRIYGGDLLPRWRETGVSVTEDLWRHRFTADVHAHAALTGDDDRFWMLSARP